MDQHRFIARYFLLSVIQCFIFDSSVFAADHAWQPVITLTGGVTFPSDVGIAQNFPPQNGLLSFYNYKPNGSSHNRFYWGIFAGAEHPIHSSWSYQGGIGYYQPQVMNVSGVVTQGVDVETENSYTYTYAIQNKQLLVENKLLYSHFDRFYPYLYLGAGVAWNNAYLFSVNIEPPFTTFSHQFNDGKNTSFLYGLGFGCDIDMQYFRLGFGYRFNDLGRVSTGLSKIDDVPTLNRLSQAHLYLNTLAVQLTLDFL